MTDVHDFAGTAPFSVEAWVNLTTANQTRWRRLVGKERYVSTSNRGGWSVMISAANDATYPNRVNFGRYDSGAGFRSVTSATTLATGTWYHVVAVFDGTSMTIYLDGVEDGTAPVTSMSVENHTTALQIARRASDDYLGATVDEVVVYDYALSPAQIAGHYAAAQP